MGLINNFKEQYNESLQKQKEKDMEKEKEKLIKLIQKYNLEDLTEKDLRNLKSIAETMASNNLFKTGLALSFGNAAEQAKIGYLDVLVQQNFMIIRQLSELNKKLK